MSNATIKKIAPFALPKLQKYLDKFKNIFRRSDTMNAAERYMTGLLSDIPYKNCGMMAEYMEGTSAQSLQDFLTNSPWDYEQLKRQRVEHLLENAVSSDGALVFDDTGFEKKGNCSVGVARQYSGTLGKVGNCQIAVSCQYSDIKYTWPVNARLYLPENWTSDPERLKKAKVPENITFKTKPQIALELLDQANSMGIKHNIILGDSFYGRDNTFIEGLEARGETYALSVPCDFTVRFEQDIKTFVPPAKAQTNRTGRPRTKPESIPLPPQYRVDWLIDKIPQDYWKVISWRDGSKGELKKQFAFIRVCWSTQTKLGKPGWLVFERPVPGEAGDTKYYFSNLPIDTPDVRIVEYVHRRYTIDRFYQDAKDELGLDQYEGRMWHGFHRHFVMVMLAYSWLTLQRRVKNESIKQYEVLVDRPCVTSPSFSIREVFSPEALFT